MPKMCKGGEAVKRKVRTPWEKLREVGCTADWGKPLAESVIIKGLKLKGDVEL